MPPEKKTSPPAASASSDGAGQGRRRWSGQPTPGVGRPPPPPPPSPLESLLAEVEPPEIVPTVIYDTEAAQALLGGPVEPEPAYSPAFLYVEKGPGTGQLVAVKQGTTVVGRATVADLRVDHGSISRRHCQIRRVGEKFFLKDLGSQNGTFLDQKRISTELELRLGHAIAVGNSLLRLRGRVDQAREREPARERQEPERPPRRRTPAEGEGRVFTPTARIPRRASPRAERRPRQSLRKLAVFVGATAFGLTVALGAAAFRSSLDEGTWAAWAERARSIVFDGASLLRSSTEVAEATGTNGAEVAPPVRGRDLERERLLREAIEKKLASQRAAEERLAAATRERQGLGLGTAGNGSAPQQPLAAADTSGTASTRSGPSVVRMAPLAPRRPPAAQAKPRAESAEAPVPLARAGGGSPSRKQTLAAYERGDAESSLEAAKESGDKELMDSLLEFLTAYDAAKDAMDSKDGAQAIANFQKALAVDQRISGGWGKYAADIRRNLGYLYTLVGLHYASADEPENAEKAFEAALKHQPSNARARAELERLREPASGDSADAKGRAQAQEEAASNGENAGAADDDGPEPSATGPRGRADRGSAPPPGSIDDAFSE